MGLPDDEWGQIVAGGSRPVPLPDADALGGVGAQLAGYAAQASFADEVGRTTSASSITPRRALLACRTRSPGEALGAQRGGARVLLPKKCRTR
jgi:hypothetical protein